MFFWPGNHICCPSDFKLLFFSVSAEGGTIGLSLSYIIGMLGFVQFIMRQSAEAESYVSFKAPLGVYMSCRYHMQYLFQVLFCS